jgi:putative DNA primase/helicase
VTLTADVFGGGDSVSTLHEPLTDAGNAEYFERRCDGRVRYDHGQRRWYFFHEHHWEADRTGEIERRALAAVRQRQEEATKISDSTERKRALKYLLESESRRRLVDLIAIAASLETLAVTGDDWDAEPMLFGVQNGVLDLETSELRPGRLSDHITKVAPVAYDVRGCCSRFERFVSEVFGKDSDLVPYMQRVFGYTLTGLTTEQVFWILWGLGSNGKSTLLETMLLAIFGADTYGWTMPFPTAMWSQTMTEYQRAELVGRRLVTASEVKQRAHLHEDFIKSLTGSDTINARHPYGRPFSFVPAAKFFLRVNEKPIIRDLTHSMWRRVKLVPFTQTFTLDRSLAATLAQERSGILLWAVRGCRDWQREGFCEPAAVTAATTTYRSESDPLTEFYAECCLIGPGLSIAGKALFGRYVAWCNERHLPPEDRLTQTAFGLRVKEIYSDIGDGRTVRYSGISVRTPTPGDAPAPEDED